MHERSAKLGSVGRSEVVSQVWESVHVLRLGALFFCWLRLILVRLVYLWLMWLICRVNGHIVTYFGLDW